MILLTIIAFIVIFSLLVLVHEWGHFIMARKAGIQVEEFGIGLPPRAKAFYKDKHGTVYSINWIPFGGYVRLHGEDSSDPTMLHDKKSFASKSLFQRTAVIVAGVVMNFLLAWVLISVGFTIGMKPFLITPQDLQKAVQEGLAVTEPVLYVHEVAPDSPASQAGIRPDDMIRRLDQAPVPSSEKFGDALNPLKPVELILLRGGQEIALTVVPNAEKKVGVTISSESAVKEVKKIRYPLWQAPAKAIQEVGRLSWLTVKMLGNVIVSLIGKFTVPEGVAGPVGIAKMTHYFVQQGVIALLQFTALISISLGVINIMPFPALDGGRFLFIVFELMLRRRPSQKWEAAIHTVGFGLLMLLLLVVTWHDIVNLIR